MNEMHDREQERKDGHDGDAQAKSAGEQQRTFTEEFKVSGEVVVSKIRELVREGNVRRITIKNEEGRTLIEIPLTIGVIGTVLLPVWAAIGAIAALAANLTLSVDRREAVPGDRAEHDDHAPLPPSDS